MGKNKQIIIDTTVELLKVNPNVSLDKIIEKSGVSKSTLHRQFESKEVLIICALNKMAKVYFDGLTAVIFEESNAIQRLFAVYKYDLKVYQEVIAMQSLYYSRRSNKSFEVNNMSKINQAHQLVFEAVIHSGKCLAGIDVAIFGAYYRSQLDFFINVNKIQTDKKLTIEKAWKIFWEGISLKTK